MKDERLESEAQRQVAGWVRGLPEEEAPSLLWRSNLNEAIRAEAASRAQKRRRWTFASPALGLATAALAFVVLFPRATPSVTPTSGGLEAGLVSLYEDSVRTDDIVGAGLRPSEAVASRAPEYDPLLDLDAGAL